MPKPRSKATQAHKGATMDDSKRTQEVIRQWSDKAVETMTVWADAQQRVLREFVEVSATTAKEGARLYAELQQNAIETLRDSQAAAIRWQSAWPEDPRNVTAWYQQAVIESVDGAQKTLRLVEGNVQAITRSVERVQSAAEHAGKGIQETLNAVASKMKDLGSQN